MDYRTVLLIVMLVIYFCNSFIWFEITELEKTQVFQIWMREVAIVVVLFTLMILIAIHVVQKIEQLDFKYGAKC